MMRRRAWWSALKIFFATVLGITHRVAARVSKSFCQLFLNFKVFSKNARIGDRSGYLAFRSRDKMQYIYSIFVRELVPLPPELSSSRTNILYLQYCWSRKSQWANNVGFQDFKNARIGDRSGDLVARSREKRQHCKYSIFVRELVPLPPEVSSSNFSF